MTMKKTFACALAAVAVSQACAYKTDELKWISVADMPLYGTLVTGPDSVRYTRLPDSLKGVVRDELYDLGTNTAGMYIRFASDAANIGAQWRATKKFNMNHMTPTGIRGLDVYVLDGDTAWTTMSSARPSLGWHNTRTMVMSDMAPRMREYMVYLPLYDGVDSIYIGVDSTATLVQPRLATPRADRPIVMYGSSITQGGCATRPGMVHTSIMSRELDRQFINLGFSGNAKLDPQIARLIATAPDPAVIVLAPLPNLTTPELVERMPGFMEIIRSAHPTVPVVMVESPIFPLMRFNEETLATITEKNRALRKIYEDLVAAGDKNLHYFYGKDILGDCVEGTVDNYHLTDLGFAAAADHLLPLLRSLLH